ncbi:hypothetical protein ACJ41O_009024 [Fusarium nematophilum]
MFVRLLGVFLAARLVPPAAPLPFHSNATIIKNAQYGQSEGGAASCISGLVDVAVVFNAQQWDIDVPTDQLSLTDWVFTYTTAGAAGFKNRGPKQVSKTYEIWVKYCVPRSAGFPHLNSTVLLVLTHGGAMDHSYWDFAQGYSYVDAAAARGMATLSYDRLDIGRSEHPGPLLEVQGDAATAVLHSLNGLVRAGAFGTAYGKVVGIGHSLGSKVTESIVSNHPGDFDAIRLTGYAYQNSPNGGDANAPGYERAHDDPQGIQLVFFKYPNFDPAIVDATVASLQTTTLGEMLIIPESAIVGNVTVLEAFTGPVMVLVREMDYSVCGFECKGERNPAETTLRDVFLIANPNKSEMLVVPGVGHNLNTHLNAAETFDHMLDWVLQL